MSTESKPCTSKMDLHLLRAAVKHLDVNCANPFIHLVQYQNNKRERPSGAGAIKDLYFLTAMCRELQFVYTFYPQGGLPPTALMKLLEDASSLALLPPNSLDFTEFNSVINAMQQIARELLR